MKGVRQAVGNEGHSLRKAAHLLAVVASFNRELKRVRFFVWHRCRGRRQWSQMPKRILDTRLSVPSRKFQLGWFDLAQIATVEVTSEDPLFPIESAFADGGQGWRAAQSGDQQIRLIFDEPVSVSRIQLRFHEPETERTQEITLSWSATRGGASKEIIRQQWNFSLAGSPSELEEYAVGLEGVSALELVIRPDITRNDAIASMAAWRVG